MKKKELGIGALLLVLCIYVAWKNPRFLSAYNLQNQAQLIGMYGIFSIGMGIVIITGGIDLSVGSIFARAGSRSVDPSCRPALVVAAGGAGGDPRRRRAGDLPWISHHENPPATFHRHPLRVADLSRHGALDRQR